MLKRSRTNIVAVCTLIVYGTLALVSVPLHFHGVDVYSSGSGAAAFTQHADAGHCGHQPIEAHHDDCTLCSAAVSEQGAAIVVAVIVPHPVTAFIPEGTSHTPSHPFHTVLSRRGPPAGRS